MRDIKFRAWDGDKIISLSSAYTKELISIQINDDNSEYSNDISTEFSHVILMQYTGLKDKNGVEIYEGDICNLSFIKNKPVIWSDGRFWLDRTLVIISKVEIDCGLEVVGNLYENPELLEATD